MLASETQHVFSKSKSSTALFTCRYAHAASFSYKITYVTAILFVSTGFSFLSSFRHNERRPNTACTSLPRARAATTTTEQRNTCHTKEAPHTHIQPCTQTYNTKQQFTVSRYGQSARTFCVTQPRSARKNARTSHTNKRTANNELAVCVSQQQQQTFFGGSLISSSSMEKRRQLSQFFFVLSHSLLYFLNYFLPPRDLRTNEIVSSAAKLYLANE